MPPLPKQYLPSRWQRERWDTERRVQIDPEPESNREETHCRLCGERIGKCICEPETEGEE